MKSFVTSFVCAVLMGLAASAKVAFTNSNFDITTGNTFTLTWSGGVGPFDIELKDGDDPLNLGTAKTLATGLSTQTLTFTPDKTLTTGTYAFEIIDNGATGDDKTNYSAQWQYVGAAAVSSSASSASQSASSTLSTVTSTSSSASSTTTGSSSSSTSTSTGTSSASKTTSTAASKTSSSPASTSTVANTNDARGLVAPFVAPLLILAGIAAF